MDVRGVNNVETEDYEILSDDELHQLEVNSVISEGSLKRTSKSM